MNRIIDGVLHDKKKTWNLGLERPFLSNGEDLVLIPSAVTLVKETAIGNKTSCIVPVLRCKENRLPNGQGEKLRVGCLTACKFVGMCEINESSITYHHQHGHRKRT